MGELAAWKQRFKALRRELFEGSPKKLEKEMKKRLVTEVSKASNWEKKLKTKPYEFQLDGTAHIERLDGRALLSDEMGLGKTIQVLSWLVMHPEVRPVIVVCPASIKYHWQREAATHIGLAADVLSGTTPFLMGGWFTPPPMLIINYEILGPWLKTLRRMKPKLIVIDECHYIKGLNTQRTKNVRMLCSDIDHVIALSGTPMVNRPAELWPTLNILRPDKFPSFTSFGIKYCAPTQTYWGMKFTGASRLHKLNTVLKKTVMIRRLKRDVLTDLPAKTRIVTPVDIEDRREYEHAATDLISWLRQYDPAKAKAAQRAERLVRFIYLRKLIGALKYKSVVNWIDNFLEESDGKIIIFGVHKMMLRRRLLKKYAKQAVLIDGSVSSKHRQDLVDQFRTNKKTRIFLGNIRAASAGWDGSVASNVAFVELDWVPGLHTQGEDRPHRIGQKNPVNINFIIARDTIEEEMCAIIQKKQRDFDAVLDGKVVKGSLNILDLLTAALLKKGRK